MEFISSGSSVTFKTPLLIDIENGRTLEAIKMISIPGNDEKKRVTGNEEKGAALKGQTVSEKKEHTEKAPLINLKRNN